MSSSVIKAPPNKDICGSVSVVGTAPGYCLDGPGIESRWEARFSPPSLLYNGYRVFPGGKDRPSRDADHSPPSSAVVIKEQSYTSTLPMDRTACTEPQCLYTGALYLYLYLFLLKFKETAACIFGTKAFSCCQYPQMYLYLPNKWTYRLGTLAPGTLRIAETSSKTQIVITRGDSLH